MHYSPKQNLIIISVAGLIFGGLFCALPVGKVSATELETDYSNEASATPTGTGSSGPYGVTIGADGKFSGYAWSTNVGWIRFGSLTKDNNNNDVEDTSCPDHSNCGASIETGTKNFSNFITRTNTNANQQSNEQFRNVVGWAKFMNEGLTGNDQWIKLSGTAMDGKLYGVKLLGNGTFIGYAWSQKYGWINFDGAAKSGDYYGVKTKEVLPVTKKFTITGSGFKKDTTSGQPIVQLVNDSDPSDVINCPVPVTGFTDTSIQVTCPMPSIYTGKWNVKVINSENKIAVITDDSKMLKVQAPADLGLSASAPTTAQRDSTIPVSDIDTQSSLGGAKVVLLNEKLNRIVDCNTVSDSASNCSANESGSDWKVATVKFKKGLTGLKNIVWIQSLPLTQNITVVAAPSAPTNLSATANDAGITLTWGTPPSDGGATITAYKIYRVTTGAGFTPSEGNKIHTISNPGSNSTFTYSNTVLADNTTYYYKVGALNSSGETYSSVASATYNASVTASGAPTNLSATVSGNQINLTWTAPSDTGGAGATISSYKVYRGTSSTNIVSTNPVCTNIRSGTSNLATLCIDPGLTYGTSYYYKVVVTNSANLSAMSAVAGPFIPATVPSAPTLTLSNPVSGTINLLWNAPSSNGSSINRYGVYRGTSASNLELLRSGGCGNITSGTSCADAGLSSGTYYYKIRALSTEGNGDFSSVVSEAVAPSQICTPMTTARACDTSCGVTASNGCGGTVSCYCLADSTCQSNVCKLSCGNGTTKLASGGSCRTAVSSSCSTGFYYKIKTCNDGILGPETTSSCLSNTSAPSLCSGYGL